MSGILFFDAASGGHHGEFLENLIYGLSLDVASVSVILAHPDLRPRLDAAKADSGSQVCLRYLNPGELSLRERAKGLLTRGRVELQIVEDVCEGENISKVFLMHMNIHQIGLSHCLRREGLSVRGLLLDPYTPMRRAHGCKHKVFALVTGARKLLQFYVMLLNPNMNRIFILNDLRLAEDLNRRFRKRPCFEAVVDPIPVIASRVERRDGGAKSCASARFTYLLFGSMDPRKGAVETLRALSQLSEDDLAKIRLRIVGRLRVTGTYRDALLDAIKCLSSRSSQVIVEMEDRFVGVDEVGSEFDQADCVLIPYINFYGSSGVLGHACRYGKPVIACQSGLVGELVRELRVGATVNPSNSAAFASKICCALRGEVTFDQAAAQRYVERAQFGEFSKALVHGWSAADQLEIL